MDVIEGGRRTAVPRLSLVLAIIALIIAAAAVAVFIASQPKDGLVVNPSQPPDASATPNLSAEASVEPSPEPSLEPSLEPQPAGLVAGGSLIEGRSQHAAVMLADGRVLITAGLGRSETHTYNYLTSTEIWNPLTKSTETSGSFDPDVDFMAKFSEEAFLLPDGRVLLVPGDCPCGPLNAPAAEIWDPSTGTWRRIDSLTVPRAGRTATMLADGRVLIAGGVLDPFHGDGATDQAVIWDPVRETSTPTGSMTAPRVRHSATRLSDGRVLLIGGNVVRGTMDLEPVSSAEIFDPTKGAFVAVPSLAGVSGKAITLPDGRVFFLDGPAAKVWDPADDSLQPAGSLPTPRRDHTTTLLSDGRILVVGGVEGLDEALETADVPALDVELWDPATLSFSVAGTLSGVRSQHTVTALPDGRALIVGGFLGEFGKSSLREIEIWQPARG